MKKSLFYILFTIFSFLAIRSFLLIIVTRNILLHTTLFLVFTFILILLLPFYIKKKNFKYNDINYLQNISTEFDTIYQTLLNEIIYKFNYNIKSLKLNIIIQYISFLISIIFLITGVIFYTFSGFDFLVVIIFFVSAIFFILYFVYLVKNNNDKKAFSIEYKNNVISTFLHLLNYNLTYHLVDSPSYKIIKNDLYNNYKDSNFDDKYYNNITITDCIEGILDNKTKFKICDLNVEEIIKFDDNNFIKDIFEGLFVSIDTSKDINCSIKIKNNKLKILNKKNFVELDNDLFEKYFDVYSENKILAIRILTLDTTEFLVDFYNKYNLNFEIIIKNKSIYIRFFTNAIFELNVFRDSTNKLLLYSYYIVFQFIKELSQKINCTLQDIEI